MLNIFSRFILWLKKIFHIRPEPKYNGTKKIPPEEEPIEVEPPEEKTLEVSPKQEIPSELPMKASEEEILTIEFPQNQRKKVRTITRKPYKKKVPTEERKKECRKPPGDERKPTISKQTIEIDLGRIKRKKSRIDKRPQQPSEVSIERADRVSKKTETHPRVDSPYVEINLDAAKVFFIIPKQQIENITVNNIPQQLHYKLELNLNEQTISVRVTNNQQGIATVEEMRIELEQPLKSFKIVYPDELQGRVYSYQHSNEILYTFIATGNNRSRMYYL